VFVQRFPWEEAWDGDIDILDYGEKPDMQVQVARKTFSLPTSDAAAAIEL